jgi:hypothetical protein
MLNVEGIKPDEIGDPNTSYQPQNQQGAAYLEFPSTFFCSHHIEFDLNKRWLMSESNE